MKLLMISGDRSILKRQQGAFWYTLQELRKHWDRIDVICPFAPSVSSGSVSSNHAPSHASSSGGQVYFHPSRHGLLFQPLWILRKGIALIREHHHDVMTVHEYPPFYNGIGALLLAKRTHIPYALEVHHIVGFPQMANMWERIARMFSRFYLPWSVGAARAVRVVNVTVKAILEGWGVPASRIAVVPSFYLDSALLKSIPRPPIAYDVSFCGRLVPNKGLRTVIQALKAIPDGRLLVVGDGPERAPCEALARALKMENRVTFLGWLPTIEAAMGAIMTARMFVMNSLSEGGPRVVLEAMGCGMPVIATRVGVMPEVIQNGINGLFTSGDAPDLEAKIRLLLSDDALRDRLGNAARAILDCFDRTKLIADYAAFLQGLSVAPSSAP
ncbi:MAG: glycosyltransferase [Candidatus Peribacteraceae bacterium]|nr:glycosyltransferase [Candidatus Peribacteraceae bacterium]